MENNILKIEGFKPKFPILKEADLPNSYAKNDIIENKKLAIEMLNTIEKFVDKTKDYLDKNFEKLNYNTWQKEIYLIKHIKFNLFVIIEQGYLYINRNEYRILDVEDYNKIIFVTKNK